MKVGIIQSNYIPWRGYFDFIRECDVFVLHDDIQYTKGDWRNRNKIKTPQGLRWLTVPVHYVNTDQLICTTVISRATNWPRDHVELFRNNYRAAPYLTDALAIFGLAFDCIPATISDLNIGLIRNICEYLAIKTSLRTSMEFGVTGRKTERILQICKALGATEYLSGPAAKVYLDEDALRREGITPLYKTYNYPEYPQLHGKFEGGVTVLDLIANVGPDARNYLGG